MFEVWWISKALMDVQHQERTCQHKFPPKFIETEKPGFSVVIWSEMNCILDRLWTWEWRKKIEIGHPKHCWLDTIKDNLRQWNILAETC